MPISPSPGRGISTAGINKTAGWGSRDVNGGIIPGHEADQGINHLAGLSESGLDYSTAVFVREVAATGIAATTATLNWATAPAAPAGSVKHRLAGGTGAYTTVAELAGTKTAHTVPLTGLVAGKTYEYIVTQPSPIAGGVAVEFSGRIHTTGGTVEDPQGATQPAYLSSGVDGAGSLPVTPPVRDSPEPPGDGSVTTAEGERERESAAGLTISAYTVDAEETEVIAFWRTSAYADGEMSLVNTVTNRTITVQESGNKRLNHEAVASDLEPNTVYLVRVTSTDASGETATSDVQEVRTG